MDPSDPAPPAAATPREIRDPRALRALAHPVRLRILEELGVAGPATATELSERVGESAANCSWHLRQLAQYGFIEEAEGGTGRQRPWRLVPETTTWGAPGEEPELARAGAAAAEMLVDQDIRALRIWNAAKRAEPAEWQQASFLSRSLTWLTPEELATVREEIIEILQRYRGRVIDPSRRPPGARPVRFVAWGIPVRREPAEPGAGPPEPAEPGAGPAEPAEPAEPPE
jgi:DNA-binding transcriptional ArsR family regulator